MFKIYNGIISEKIDQRDFEFAGDINELNLPIPLNAQKGVYYNQKEVSDMSCTIHACMGAITDLTGYVFSLEERKKLWEEAKKQGASDSYGWYVSDAVNLVRKYVNTLGIGNFVTVRTTFGSDVFYKAIKQGYSGIGIYKGNKLYNEDIADDGVVEETNLTGNSTYSHCIRYVWGIGVEVRDNYLGSKTWKNEYKIKYELELYKNSVISPTVYFFVEDSPTLPLNRKLLERLEDRLVYCPDVDKFGIVKNGKLEVFAGKHISETFKYKYKNTNESYTLGLNLKDFKSIGFKN
jgi:hypothetical protein